MRLPYSVQVFLIRIVEGRPSYLLFHRNARPELGLPDFWQGISGALEAEESFADAARREVEEETGIVLTAVSDADFQHAYPVRVEWRPWYGPDPIEVREHVFFAVISASTEPVLSTEHKSWRWCSPSEAAALLTFGANGQCLNAVEASLAQK